MRCARRRRDPSPLGFSRFLGGLALAGAILAGGCQERSVGAPGYDAAAVDAGPGADAARLPDAWVPPDAAYYCPLDAPDQASVSGTTPLGAFAGQRAWFGVLGGECHGLTLYVTPDRAAFEAVLQAEPYGPMPPSVDVLVLGLTSGLVPGTEPGTEEGNAWVSVWRGEDSRSAQTRVTFTLRREPLPNDFTPENDPWLGGRFTVAPDAEGNNAGWQLTGTFSAAYCSRTNVYCP